MRRIFSEEQHREVRRNRRLTACIGKEAFESRTLCEEVARRRRSQGLNNRAYKCIGCGKYHIGRPNTGRPNT